ncbi:hypothetical protein [Spirosoma endophyticum]|uniref:Uncharacterized protein n=1 Tax=Spirosoma endophyticum TaxID=662367 RepID=A0A1I2IG41_9BACT|nr:hypothetical protein [Spirosoma endophyticum]SFF39806.1 hypothetical protein SAMN05216167_1664 [Spirosoma endophyticum]
MEFQIGDVVKLKSDNSLWKVLYHPVTTPGEARFINGSLTTIGKPITTVMCVPRGKDEPEKELDVNDLVLISRN